MRMPSRNGLINHPEKEDFRFPGGLHVERLTRKVSMVKTPRNSSSTVQLSFLDDQPRIPYYRSAEDKVQMYGPLYEERVEMALQKIRRCNTCKIVKPYAEFHTSPSAQTIDHVVNICKDCMLVRQRRWYMRRTYGITLEEYASLYEAQDGKCAICGEVGKSAAVEKTDHVGRGASSGVLSVDHDHTSGKVRALLCQQCNHGIGALRDDPQLLRKAIAYLETHTKAK